MSGKKKRDNGTQVKEDAKKFEEASDSQSLTSKIPQPTPQGASQTIPTTPKPSSSSNPLQSFQWGTHPSQLPLKPPYSPTGAHQWIPPALLQPPAQPQQDSSLKDLLLEMKQDNKNTALANQKEFIGLRNAIASQETSLAKKITESNDNLKKLINENSVYFQKEIDKINDKFEEGERKQEQLIERALKAERERWESRFAQIERPQAGTDFPPLIQPGGSQRELEAPSAPPSAQVFPKPPQFLKPIPTRGENGHPEEAGEKEKESQNSEREEEKPERFLSEEHEKEYEINVHKKKLIMKVERKDFIEHMLDYRPEFTDDYIFKNPINNVAIMAGVKQKIFNATGIPHYKLKIKRVSISTKRAKLAWVSFESKRIVSYIFRLAMQNGGNQEFNAFPHIPGKAMRRHDAVINILKRLQESNTQLRYQVRLGKSDIELRAKNHFQYDYRPYVKIDLAMIDPNNEIPDWELSFKRTNPCSQPTSITLEKEKKRLAEESPENQKKLKRKRFVPEWQIGEFLWMYLEGTKTTPEYSEVDTELETESNDNSNNAEKTAENTQGEAEAEENFDIK